MSRNARNEFYLLGRDVLVKKATYTCRSLQGILHQKQLSSCSLVLHIKGTGPGKILELRRRTFERTVMFGDSCQVEVSLLNIYKPMYTLNLQNAS